MSWSLVSYLNLSRFQRDVCQYGSKSYAFKRSLLITSKKLNNKVLWVKYHRNDHDKRSPSPLQCNDILIWRGCLTNESRFFLPCETDNRTSVGGLPVARCLTGTYACKYVTITNRWCNHPRTYKEVFDAICCDN